MSTWMFFDMCPLYPPLTNIVDFQLSQFFFHNFRGGSKFSRGSFHPKNDAKKKKEIFFRRPNQAEEQLSPCFFFDMCPLYPHLNTIVDFTLSQFFFHSIVVWSKFFQGNFHPKNDPQFFFFSFFADQIRIKDACLRGLFLLCNHYFPL